MKTPDGGITTVCADLAHEKCFDPDCGCSCHVYRCAGCGDYTGPGESHTVTEAGYPRACGPVIQDRRATEGQG